VRPYTRTAGVRHLFAAYELGGVRLYGHIKPRKTRARFLEFCRYPRSLYPYSYEYKNVGGPADNFWTVTTQPYGTFAAAHGHEDPQPCLKFSLYGAAEQEKVHDRFEGKLATKEPGTYGASYCELKVYAAADIPDLMKRLRLAYGLKVKAGRGTDSA